MRNFAGAGLAIFQFSSLDSMAIDGAVITRMLILEKWFHGFL
jgi:hypothetical protein